MRRVNLLRLPLCQVIATAAFILATRGISGNQPTSVAKPLAPKLVVVVSVDQYAGEYFERFHHNFEKKGFYNRTQAQGAWFANCRHRHAFTVTAPGHAVLLTGCYADRHGITENEMYDRQQSKTVYCVDDPTAKVIGEDGIRPVSPRRLLTDTVGDRLKLESEGKSKVFGLAIKDRASILMCGRLADAAFWMSDKGNWVTSDFYRPDLPGYLRVLNEGNYLHAYANKSWKLSLAPDRYCHGPVENNEFERPYAEMTPGFPHVMPAADDSRFIKHLACSPFGNESVVAAASQLIKEEELGLDDHPDLLCINFSSNDYVGHSFGPQSLEAEDMTYRTDALLGQFAEDITEMVHGRPWLMVISADHGVAPVPEIAAKRKLFGARGPLKLDELKAEIELAARAAIKAPDDPARLVQAVTDNEVFFNFDHPLLAGDEFAVAQRAAQRVLSSKPEVSAAVTRDQVLGGQLATPLQRQIALSFHPIRSGDVLFTLGPYSIPSGSAGTTHGSPWVYDAHVPLAFLPMGEGATTSVFGRGWHERIVAPAQIAPTLSRLLRIDMPAGCVEEPLYELLPAAKVKRD
jgi:predicted AlkP superfamily pyrophosphatase or phosphodiesterase